MAEKIYNISSIKSVRGDPELIENIVEGTGDVIDISGTSIEKIKEYRFYKSSCNEVKLPDTVKVIGKEAFYFTHNLNKINLDSVDVLCENSLNGSHVSDIGNPKLKVISKGALSQTWNLNGENFDSSEVKIFSGDANSNMYSYANLEFPKLEYILDASYSRNTHYIPYTVKNLGGSSLWSNTNSGVQDTNGLRFKYVKDPEDPNIEYGWLIDTATKNIDLVIPENTIGLSERCLNGTFKSIKFPETLKYFSYSWATNAKISNNVYVPSLEWWFSRDFCNNRDSLQKIFNNEYASSYCAFPDYYSTNLQISGHICDYDGNILDESTEITLPETAGIACLGKFNKLEKLTINLGDERQVNPNTGHSLFNIGFFFDRYSTVTNTYSVTPLRCFK